FLEDFAELLQRLVPRETYYAHDDWDKRTENICPEAMAVGNGHSHCMAMLLGTAGESLPVRDGGLCLGTSQRARFIELDRQRARPLSTSARPCSPAARSTGRQPQSVRRTASSSRRRSTPPSSFWDHSSAWHESREMQRVSSRAGSAARRLSPTGSRARRRG